MSRSRAHLLLQLDLAAATGVPVEVRWGSCVPSVHHPGGWAWYVFWSDGPTVAGMRAKAEPAARTLPGVGAEQLVYDRTVRPCSCATTRSRVEERSSSVGLFARSRSRRDQTRLERHH